MQKNDLIIRIAGEGGEGIVSSGDFISAACARAGLEVYTFKTFPAEIKGGYCLYQVRTSAEPITCQGDTFDVFCAFNGEAYELNKHLLKPGTALVYDFPGGDFEPDDIPEGVHLYPIPMSKTAKANKNYRAKNMVALGALSHLFNVDEATLKEVLTDKFVKKSQQIVDDNIAAFDQGKALAQELEKTDTFRVSDPLPAKDVIIISGNEAVGLGGMLGKMDFFAAYPLTPSTEVAKFASAHMPKTGGKLIQAEDEIASMNMLLGASWAGARVMTSTSGPGVCLMSEAIGMASMSETPCVIVDVQRGGPSTGLPTKHEQSDLFLCINGTHGDASKIVLSAENVKDCVDLSVDALNLADKYQCPVLLLTDGSLAFSTQTIARPKPESYDIIRRKTWDGEGVYKRYEWTEDNISVMCEPGTPGGMHVATGLEHKESGAPAYDPYHHEKNSKKRFDKLKTVEAEYKPAEVDGVEGKAKLGIITWGSTIGVVREAVARLTAEGYSVKALYPKLLWPFPTPTFENFADDCDKILVPEINYQGQLSHFIRAETNISPIPYTICGGLPFTPAMVVDKAKEVLES